MQKIEQKQGRGIGLKKEGRERERENRGESGLYHPLTGVFGEDSSGELIVHFNQV